MATIEKECRKFDDKISSYNMLYQKFPGPFLNYLFFAWEDFQMGVLTTIICRIVCGFI